MTENKDVLSELIGGLPYVTSAGYEPVPPPFDQRFPTGTLCFYAYFTHPDGSTTVAKRFILEPSYTDSDRNIDNVSCMQWLIEQLRIDVPLVDIDADTPPPPPEPVTDDVGG